MNSRVRPAERVSAAGKTALESEEAKSAEKLHESDVGGQEQGSPALMLHETEVEEEADVTGEKPPGKENADDSIPIRGGGTRS